MVLITPEPDTGKLYKWLSIIFIACLPYLFTLHGDFVFDDTEAILKNKDVTANSWVQSFYNDFWGTSIKSASSHKSYRPLTILSYRLNYQVNSNKLSALHFKTTNLLCHIICCLLVWLTYECILNNEQVKIAIRQQINIPYISTLIFAVHPVHTEAICGIVGRADILAGVTFFLAFLSYNKLKSSKNWLYIFYFVMTILLATLSMLFKENGVTVLGYCLCYEIITNIRINTCNLSKIKCTILMKFKSFTTIILLLVSISVLLYVRWTIMGGSKPEFKPTDNPAAFAESFLTKVSTYSYIYLINALLLVWPHWLCYDWSMGCVPLINSVLDYRLLLAISFYLSAILVLLLSVINRKNKMGTKRLLILAVSLVIIPFLPASNVFFAVGFVIAERILYIPSAGYCLLVAMGLNKIVALRKGKLFKVLVDFGTAFLILSFGLRSWQKSYDWQNEYNLYVSGLSVCPLNAKVHYNVAKVADAKNNTEWAMQEYKEAIRLYPEYYQAMNNLANLFKSQRRFSEAKSYLKLAVKYKRDFPAAWMNLGIVYAGMKRYEESYNAYQTALQYRPNYPDCFYNLGNLNLEINKSNNAIESWFHAINLNPKHVLAWTNLLAILDNTDQLDKAMELIPKALTELPKTPSINFAIANIYGKMGRYNEAEKYFIAAIELFGDKVQAIHYANLGVLYHRWKRYDKAEEMYGKSLIIDPMFASSRKNLKSLNNLKYNKKGNKYVLTFIFEDINLLILVWYLQDVTERCSHISRS